MLMALAAMLIGVAGLAGAGLGLWVVVKIVTLVTGRE